MRRDSLTSRVLALFGALLLSGCYTYLPVSSAPPGSPVRVVLPVETRTSTGAVTRSTLAVEGTLVSAGDTIEVATESTEQVGNFRQVSLLDTLRVPASEVDALELREFSGTRTAVLTGLVTAGAVLILVGIVDSLGGSEGGDGGGGDPTGASITLGTLGGLLKLLGRR